MLKSDGIVKVVVVVAMLMVLQASSAQVPETLPLCPLIRCAPGCVAVIGPNGCPVRCACHTCEGMNCAKDEECILRQIFCITVPCFPIPKCVPKQKTTTACPTIKCAPGCSPFKGPDGCLNRCICPRTCKDFKCNKYEVCIMKMVGCVAFRCFSVPTCVPRISMCLSNPKLRSCELACSNGFKTDANGCTLCKCNEDIE